MIMELGSWHNWMHLVEYFSFDISGASEVLQSHGKMIFIYLIKEVKLACVHTIISCVCIHTSNTYISIVVRIH